MNDGERFSMFTPGVRRILNLAQEEAQRFDHNYIGTEHLLLGLVRLPGCAGIKTLVALNIEPTTVREQAEHIIGRNNRTAISDPGLTPRAKRVLELSVDEARRLISPDITTAHLLLGLVREGEGIAGGVLMSLGVTLERAREQVRLLLEQAHLDMLRQLGEHDDSAEA